MSSKEISADQSALNALSTNFNQRAFYTSYRRTFDVVEADNDALRELAFKLRYQVYCVENAYEDREHNAAGMEEDAYDIRAKHFLLMHKESNKAVGTVRVLMPDEDNQYDCFPMQSLCDHPILHTNLKPLTLCQISRLCMAKEFRRREGDGALLPAYHEQEDKNAYQEGNMIFIRRRITYAPLGLFSAAFGAVLNTRIMDCICMMEPDQLQNFNKMGITYRSLGPRIDYHGGMQPIIFNIKTVLDTMLLENQQCWDIVSDMGRIHKVANLMHLNDWQDSIFDDECRDEVYRKLL